MTIHKFISYVGLSSILKELSKKVVHSSYILKVQNTLVKLFNIVRINFKWLIKAGNLTEPSVFIKDLDLGFCCWFVVNTHFFNFINHLELVQFWIIGIWNLMSLSVDNWVLVSFYHEVFSLHNMRQSSYLITALTSLL